MDIEDTIFNNDLSNSLDKKDSILSLLSNLLEFVKDEEKINNDHFSLFYDKMKKKFTQKLQNEMRGHKFILKKSVIIYHYKSFINDNKLEKNDMLMLLLMKKPANDISGINQVTILTSPHPDGQTFSCKHDCYYCPNEPAHEKNNWTPQPRSYLFSEPAVLRANRNKFDPYLQTKSRLDSLFVCGQKCDKLEFILEGGTFTEYPKKYLKNYFTQFIYCVNTYFSQEKREPLTLEEEITLNKTADCKIVGICIETRPDAILEDDEDGVPWLKTLLLWGVTRIQIGVQHIDNYILKKINRGHSIEKVIKAIEVMKNNCFKVDIHLMPDLPYSSPEKDKNMFDIVFKSDKIQADQMKIYPCEVVPWTKIKTWYEEGTYKPYGENKELIKEVLQYGMNLCKPWIRICRMVRDIPDTYIEGGMKCGNMRQELITKFNDQDLSTGDIRFREIGRHPKYKMEDAQLKIRNYKASNGDEYFISYETPDEKAIYGFIRLRIPFKNRITYLPDENNMQYKDFKMPIMFNETLKDSGLIRELHVYGGLNKVNTENTQSSYQHKGFGTKLLQQAEEICLKNNINKLSIISGIGVRGYYEKKGYHLENCYMVKDLNVNKINENNLIYFVILFTMTIILSSIVIVILFILLKLFF